MNHVKIVIVVLTVLTLLFGIIAIATNYWLEGCFDLHRYLDLYVNVLKESPDHAIPYMNIMNMLNGSFACFASGLFKFEVDLTTYTDTLDHNSEESATLQATSTLLLLGLIIQIVATVLTHIGSYQDPSGSKGRNLFVAGTVVFSASMLFLMVGMTVYTALFVDAKHSDPMLFFDQFREGIFTIGNKPSVYSNISYTPPPGSINYDLFDEEMEKVERGAVVKFGYSIYLGWTSFFISFLNLCVAVCACLKKKRESATHIVMS